MPNYQNGKIYRIINDVDNEEYVGSSCSPLWKRWGDHKSICNKGNNRKLYKHIRNIGVENFKIVLIENWPCKNKDELTAREQHYIDQLKPSLNFQNAKGFDFQREKERHKQYGKKYKQSDRFDVKHSCSCGGSYRVDNKSRHIKTKLHQNYINDPEYIPDKPLF